MGEVIRKTSKGGQGKTYLPVTMLFVWGFKIPIFVQ